MHWGGEYGAVEDVWIEPHLILDAEERLAIDRLRREWFMHGLPNVARADRPRAEAALAELYHLADLRRPKFIWLDSPRAEPAQRDEFVEFGGVWCLPRIRLWQRSTRAVNARRRNRTGALAQSRLGGQPGFDPAELSSAFFPPAGDPIQLDSCRRNWPRRLELWGELGRSCGGWTSYERECWISERPTQIRLEGEPEAPRLRFDDGPAVVYRDGSAIHAPRASYHDTSASWS